MRSLRHLVLAMAMILGLTLVTACGSSDDGTDQGGTVVGSVDRGPEKKVRKTGDQLTVVALGWSDGEIAASLGVAPTAIYDWQGHGKDTKGVGPWAKDSVADADIEVIKNSGTSYNYEQIELMEPDLILNVRAAKDDKVFDRLSKIAPVAAAPQDAPDFAVDWRTQTEIIGQAIGKEDAAKKAVADTEKTLTKAAKEHPEFDGKTFVYGAKFGDAYGGYVKGDARFDVFGKLGFVENPALAKLKPSGGFFANVAAEQVKAFDADVAVLTTIGLPLKDLKDDQKVASLDVVKDDRAIILDEKDEVNAALAAGTPQSIALAVEEITPDLEKAVATVE
ncbi:MAG: ABC transporter substrate-binding protein [Janibacter sp.]